MRTLPIGTTGLRTSAIAYGGMSLVPERRDQGIRTVHAALDAGITLFDTADIYAAGEGERILGEALRTSGRPRDGWLVASKCGIVPAGSRAGWRWKAYDTSAAAIERACEEALRRLGVDCIDLWYLHRIDHLAHPDEIAAAFDRLRAAGRIRHAAVSNYSGPELDTLAAATPLAALQVEFSLLRQDPLEQGLCAQALRHRLALFAWSPLGGGVLTGGRGPRHDDARGQREEGVAAQVAALARELGVAPATLALAWLLRLPGSVVPIVGTASPQHLADAVAAAELELPRDLWYQLMVIGRGRPIPWQPPAWTCSATR